MASAPCDVFGINAAEILLLMDAGDYNASCIHVGCAYGIHVFKKTETI